MSMPLLDFEQTADRRQLEGLIGRLAELAAGAPAVAEVVGEVIDAVRRDGDDAVVRYMRRWTNPSFRASDIRVSADAMAEAFEALDPALRQTMARAIEHIRAYESHIKPADSAPITIDGARLSVRFTPIDRVGLHVPGGRASYPSTAMMLAVPAQVAGCRELAVVSPPPTVRAGEPADAVSDISPLVLAVCHMLGLTEVYRIGGAQAIAALALGTQTVKPVDLVVGPGNAYTQEAKRRMVGRIGIDGFFGPSEVVVLVDDSCSPAVVASDLIAQAEHDPGCCFLIGWSRPLLEQILAEVSRQLPARARMEPLAEALGNWSAAVCCVDRAQALELVDRIAGEHVILAVSDPERTLTELRHGGAWFLGHYSPVAAGDYYTGPNHSLPTGTTARFGSGLSVYTFLKRSSVEYYPQPPSPQTIADIVRFAGAEGLEAHAESVRLRSQS